MASKASPAGKSPLRNTNWGCIAMISIVVVVGSVIYLMYPTIDTAFKEQKASTDLSKAVERAVLDYQKEYGKEQPLLPAPVEGQPDPEATTAQGSPLVKTLLGQDAARNPKNINFLEKLPAAEKSKDGKFSGGLISESGNSGIVDAWGRVFHVRIAGEGDGFVVHPDPAVPATVRKLRLAVWSAGADGDFSTWADNMASWK